MTRGAEPAPPRQGPRDGQRAHTTNGDANPMVNHQPLSDNALSATPEQIRSPKLDAA